MNCYLFSKPLFFLISSQVPALLYYAQIPATLIALLVSFFIFWKEKKHLLNQIFFLITIFFSFWSISNLIEWTNIHSSFILFIWSFQGIILSLSAIFCIYFIYVFLEKKDIPNNYKVYFIFLVAPIIFLTPTYFNLSGFDITSCDAFNFEWLPFKIYYSLLGLLAMFWIFFMLACNYQKASKIFKKQIILMGLGIESFLFFLFFFMFLAEYLTKIGIFSDSEFGIYGMFGMIIFMVYIGILIVEFKTFNIKLIATQALIVAEIILVFSLVFSSGMQASTRIIVGLTTLLVSIVGYLLIKSVKKEVEQREQLGELAGRLELANEQLKAVDERKSDFINIASHQLRTPTTAIKGYTALLLEGDYGEMPEKIKEITARMNNLADQNVKIIADMLNISRIEQNRMKYTFEKVEIAQFILDIIHTLELKAHGKNLPFEYVFDKTLNESLTTDLSAQAGKKVYANVDKNLLAQVFENVMDNAVKYTLKGYVKIDVRLDGKKLIFKCVDTGIGIDKESLATLFKKFGRAKNAQDSGIEGTGIGLYIAKEIMQKHNGDITITSEGEGKGSESTITMEVDSAESHVATVN